MNRPVLVGAYALDLERRRLWLWFLRGMGGEDIRYACGYGGQILYVAPRLGLSVVMTSDDAPRATTIADRDNRHALSARIIDVVRAG